LLKYKRRWKVRVYFSGDYTLTIQWYSSKDQARRCAEQHIFEYYDGAQLDWGETIDMRRPCDKKGGA